MFPPSSSKETYNPSCSGRVVCMFPCLHHVVVEQFACSYVFTLLTGGNSYPSADLIVGILTLGTSPCVLRHGPQYHFYCVFADGANGTLVMHPCVYRPLRAACPSSLPAWADLSGVCCLQSLSSWPCNLSYSCNLSYNDLWPQSITCIWLKSSSKYAL